MSQMKTDNHIDYVSIKLFRGESKESRYVYYKVPFQEGINVLWVLKYIYENIDSSIAYPLCLCRLGKCGNCAVRLNGKNVLACSEIIDSTKELVIEPIKNKKIIRDLVVVINDYKK